MRIVILIFLLLCGATCVQGLELRFAIKELGTDSPNRRKVFVFACIRNDSDIEVAIILPYEGLRFRHADVKSAGPSKSSFTLGIPKGDHPIFGPVVISPRHHYIVNLRAGEQVTVDGEVSVYSAGGPYQIEIEYSIPDSVGKRLNVWHGQIFGREIPLVPHGEQSTDAAKY